MAVVEALTAETEVPVMYFGASALTIAVLGAWLIEHYSRITQSVRVLGHLLVAATVIGLCVDGGAVLPTQAEWMLTSAMNIGECLLAAMLDGLERRRLRDRRTECSGYRRHRVGQCLPLGRLCRAWSVDASGDGRIALRWSDRTAGSRRIVRGDRTEFCLGAGTHTHYFSNDAVALAEIDRLVEGYPSPSRRSP